MKLLKFLFFSMIVSFQGSTLGEDQHTSKGSVPTSEWNSKSGLDFCSGQGLRRLLALVQKQPPMHQKNTDLIVPDWQEISQMNSTWAKDIPKDPMFDSKIKSIFIYPRKDPSEKIMRSAKVTLEYFNGTKEEINIDPPLFLSKDCSQYVYESEPEVPRGSLYKIHDALYVVSSETAFSQMSSDPASLLNTNTPNPGDVCECKYKPENFPELKVSVVCGKNGSSCDCSVHAAPAIHGASYLYVMQANCGGKQSKNEPIIGELGIQLPKPIQKVIKK